MSNVIEFPNKPKKPLRGAESMERELNTLQRALNARFDRINKAQEQILTAEKEIDKLQTTYDKILKQYATKIGSENVAMKYIDYATSIKFEHADDGSIEIRIEE